jgi:hypothetical protein
MVALLSSVRRIIGVGFQDYLQPGLIVGIIPSVGDYLCLPGMGINHVRV